MKISDERAEAGLRYLAETDERCGHLKAEVERAEFKAKAIRDAVFLRVEGTVAERSALAGSSKEYADAMDAYFDLLGAYEGTRNKRATEAIVLDTWRTVQANQRRGNV